MDPQAAWDQLQEAYRDRDWETVRELAQSLLDWLDRGGFPPVVTKVRRSDATRQRTLVTKFCNDVLQQMVELQTPLCECFRPNS